MKKKPNTSEPNSTQRGAVLPSVVVVVASLATISLTVVSRTQATYQQARGIRELQAARYMAEAGLNAAFIDLNTGGDGFIGNQDQPIGFGGGDYWVEAADLGAGLVQLTARGNAQGGGVQSEMILRPAVSPPTFGAFGGESIALSSNALIDSYNSSLGTYASQIQNSQGSVRWANANGNVASNGTVTLSQNASIFGNAASGATAVTTLAPQSRVTGSSLPRSKPYAIPQVSVPAGTSSGDLIVTDNATLDAGLHFFDTLCVRAGETLTVIGPVILVVDELELEAGAELLIDADDGDAQIYVRGRFTMEDDALLAPLSENPADLSVILLADNIADPDLEREGNAESTHDGDDDEGDDQHASDDGEGDDERTSGDDDEGGDERASGDDDEGDDEHASSDDGEGDDERTSGDDDEGGDERASSDDDEGGDERASGDDDEGDDEHASGDDDEGDDERASGDDDEGDDEHASGDDDEGDDERASGDDDEGDDEHASGDDDEGDDERASGDDDEGDDEHASGDDDEGGDERASGDDDEGDGEHASDDSGDSEANAESGDAGSAGSAATSSAGNGIVFGQNSRVYGRIVAPDALIEVTTNFELWGSLVARRVLLSGNSMIHFDENLNKVVPSSDIVYEVTGWIEFPIYK